MKKLLLLLVGAIVAMTAHAQLYVCGDDSSIGSWNPDDALVVNESNGYYSFKAPQNKEFQMSTSNKDGWDGFNGSILSRVSDSWATNDGIKSVALKTGKEGDFYKFKLTDSYLYVRVKSDLSLIELSETEDFGGGDVVVGDNTFYFYDCNNANYTDVYTYVYGNGASMSGPEKMTSTGKYVREGDNYYPVWSYTPSVQPTNVMFTKDSGWGNKLSTDEPAYAKGGFYYLSGSSLLSKTGLVLVDKEEPATVYELWTNFRNGDTFVGMLLNEKNSYSYTLEFLGDETGTKVGLHVNNDWRGASNTSAYDGNAKTYNMTTTQGGDITFAEGLKGAVTFVLNVADNTLSVSGGAIEQPGETDYTIYFYDRNNVGTDFYVHMWIGDGESATTFKPWGKDDAIKMQPTGKYIYRNGKYYPLYVLNFSWNKKPEKLLIWNGEKDSEKQYVSRIVFLNNGYYTNGATKPETDLSPVEPESGDKYLYFHLKEDLLYEGVNGGATPVYCNVMKDDAYIGGRLVRDDAHKMELVSAKYQIYRYRMNDLESLEGNNVEFSFQDKKGWSVFRASNSEKFNQGRWAEFIYATAMRGINGADVQYAIQTYMSWSDFAELDAKGRPSVYLVGEGAIEGLTWNAADAREYNNPDGSCFYVPVNVTGKHITYFKVSWVNAGYYKANATQGMTSEARDWATFDLGIVGVDDKYAYPDGSYKLSVMLSTETGQSVNSVKFDTNTSVKYCNYNQYNWAIDGTSLIPGQYYVVIDTHDTCRTVTLVDFDPNPSVSVTDASVAPVTLSADQAKSLHRHYNHLSLASHNGHIPMDKVNTCEGTLTISGSKGLDINNAGFDIEYTVSMNGDEVVSYHGKPGRIHLNYMPLATSNDIKMRAKYTDIARSGRNGTGLTFHSRRGEATVTVDAKMPAPTGSINNAKYAMDYDGVYGVLIDNISMSVSSDYNVYGDISFEFDDPTVDTSRRVHIIHRGYDLQKAYNTSVLKGWTPLVMSDDSDFSNYDFDGGSNDWSSKIIQDGVNVPVYLSKYTDISDKSLLESKAVNGLIYAIYPFLYETKPSFNVEEEGSSAPRKAAAAVADLPADLEGFALSHYSRSTPISAVLDAKNAVSGVENVAADMEADGDAEYYTISGVRVQGAPAPGIYLRRQGDKVAKVVVR